MTETSVEKNLRFDLDELGEGVVRIVVNTREGQEVGVLYFERAKKIFNRKPVSMGSWNCVDAKVEGLYDHIQESITPKDIVDHCQDLIMWSGL
jgi:predicted SnoaL-like aldol condensation-catalyzing enzyme